MDQNKELVLITGGSGLIGQRLAHHFKEKFQVVALDIKEPKSPDPAIGFVQLNTSDETIINNAFETIKNKYGNKIASVIHLAAYYSFDVAESDQYEEITVKGTEKVLRALQSFDVEQFIFSSTMLVHSPVKKGEVINEDSEVEPQWAYPASKVRAEHIIRQDHGEIPYLILRIAGVYDDKCHSIPIGNHIERINEYHLTSHFFPGNMDTGSAFIHMDDLVSAFSKAVEKRKTLPAELTLILGENETMSFRELQDMIAKNIYDKEWMTQQIPKTLAKLGAWMQERVHFGEKPFIKSWMVDLADHHYQLDTTLAEKYLDWRPQKTLRTTLPKMIHYLKTDPESFYRENKLSKPINTAIAIREKLPALIFTGVLGSIYYLMHRRKAQT